MVTTVAVSMGATVLFLFGVGGVVALIFSRTPTRKRGPVEHQKTLVESNSARIGAMESRLDGIMAVWEDEYRRARRERLKAESAEKSVIDLLTEGASGDGVDPEDGDIPFFDAEPSAEGVLPVPEAVAPEEWTDEEIQAEAARVMGW